MMQGFFSRRTLIATVCTLASLVSGAVFAESKACSLLTTPYSATYVGSYKGWKIETLQELRKLNANQWQLGISADNLLGKIKETSTFQIRNQVIESQHYSYWRNVMLKNVTVDTAFDWKTHQATTTGNKTGKVTLKGGEFDGVGYQLQLRCDLMNGVSPMIYPVVERNDIDKLEFQVVGEEELETSLGKLNTVVVKRVRNNSNRITTLWFAKDLDYLMVKLLQEERKDTQAYLLYIGTYNRLPTP